MIVELRLLIGFTCLVIGGLLCIAGIRLKDSYESFLISLIGLSFNSFGILWIIWTIVRYFAGGQAGTIAEVAHGFASAGGGY